MATVLGKRKKSSGTKEATGEDTIQDIFRRHFEAQFKPLAVVAKKAGKKGKATATETETSSKELKRGATVVINENESVEESDGSDDDSNDDESEASSAWSGLSEDEDENDNEAQNAASAIEVVDYSTDPTKEAPAATMTKHERKLYLVSVHSYHLLSSFHLG